MRSHRPNKILLKAPKKKKSTLLQYIALFCILFTIGYILNYFIFSNNLIDQPYFPSYGVELFNQIVTWSFVLLIGGGINLYGFLVSYNLMTQYRQQKTTFILFSGFLYCASITFGLAFGYMAHIAIDTLMFSISSQLAKNIGTPKHEQIQIRAQIHKNSAYGQTMRIQKGKTTKHILDPVTYIVPIQLQVNNKNYALKPYCYTQTEPNLTLSSSSFRATGKSSLLGFRCTAQCELHQYFQTEARNQLSLQNFTDCSRIYQQQPTLD